MLEQLTESINLVISQTRANFHNLLMIMAVLWGSFLLTRFMPGLLCLGVIPRTIQGLPGILLAPLLHKNFNHIFFNSIPFAVLGNFLLINGLNYFLIVSLAITIISGILLWMLGKPGLHIGASGLVTGYWGLLVFNIVHLGNITAIILGVICIWYFAGIFFNILPLRKGVSSEGHLFGLIAGFGVAAFM